MSRAESPARIIDAAIRLGAAEGPSALSVQGVADAAGVSKALVLYHFSSKAVLLRAIVASLGERSAARLRVGARERDPQAAWREIALAECASRELALLGALALEPEVPATEVARVNAMREAGGSAFAERLLASVGLRPRIPIAFVARMLVRELDGLVLARGRAAHDAEGTASIVADQDAMLLALLALGR